MTSRLLEHKQTKFVNSRRSGSNFGFPFIMAVKGRRRDEIRAAFERRLENDAETEFDTALAEIERIALFRLRDLLG